MTFYDTAILTVFLKVIQKPTPRKTPCQFSRQVVFFNQMVKSNSLSQKKGVKSSRRPVNPKRAKTAAQTEPNAPTHYSTPASAETFGDAEHRILAAARREFIAKGLDGARMQAVATDAGVNKALLHYYYRSKDKLYRKVLEDTIATVWGKLQTEFRAQPQTTGVEGIVHTIVSTYIRTLSANPDFPLFVFREIAGGFESQAGGLSELFK